MNGVVPLLKFTPSAQDPHVLETITVQREPLVAELVENALEVEGGARHQLLIGPRGIGKTHILSLVASRVRAERKSDSVVLAWLEEDPWGITTYEKFLAAVVAGVAAENSDDDLGRKADELHASHDGDGREGEQVLRDALGESRLVLLVENLDEIFRRIGENGQERFRAFAEDWPRLLIVATAPQLFEGIQLHESPFYGFFAITRLAELSLASATELMRRVAELRGDSDLVKFLGTDVAGRRLAAIEALAGGHPRVWLLLSGCVSIKAIDELVPLFLEALDDLTPYYQDRLRELSDQQQELVVLLSEAGGALSNRALAERSGIAQNQVATILRQLTDRGYVRRAEVSAEIAIGDARMSYWELREPLMRLCLDVKQARGKPLRMLVEFLRAWYGSRLLDELAMLPPSAQLAATYVSEAFRTFEDALQPDDLLRGSPSEILTRAELGLSLAPERPGLHIARAAGLMMEGQFVEARDALEALIPTVQSETTRLALRIQLLDAKEALGEQTDPGSLVEGLLKLREANPDDSGAQEVVAFGLSALNRHDEALRGFPRALELRPESAVLFGSYGKSLRKANRLEEALEAYEKAVELDPDNPAYRRYVGATLESLGRDEEALDVLGHGLELDPDDAQMHGGRGIALFRLGRIEEALSAFANGAELEPGDGSFLIIQGDILTRLARFDEALEAFRKASEVEPSNAWNFYRQASLLRGLERLDEAELAVRRAIDLEASEPVYRFALWEISLTLDDVENALPQLREALAIWSETREGVPGETELLCRILWERSGLGVPRSKVIDQIVEAYDEVGAGEQLGRGLVSSISWMAGPEVGSEVSDSWAADWLAAHEVDDLQIPMRLLQAASAWKRDRDRSHLLDLPPEQREILVDLLMPEATSDDRDLGGA